MKRADLFYNCQKVLIKIVPAKIISFLLTCFNYQIKYSWVDVEEKNFNILGKEKKIRIFCEKMKCKTKHETHRKFRSIFHLFRFVGFISVIFFFVSFRWFRFGQFFFQFRFVGFVSVNFFFCFVSLVSFRSIFFLFRFVGFVSVQFFFQFRFVGFVSVKFYFCFVSVVSTKPIETRNHAFSKPWFRATLLF